MEEVKNGTMINGNKNKEVVYDLLIVFFNVF